MGASTTFTITVSICTMIAGCTMPVPRSADPITTIANCSAKLGRNQ
jgi:hypothetical protein